MAVLRTIESFVYCVALLHGVLGMPHAKTRSSAIALRALASLREIDVPLVAAPSRWGHWPAGSTPTAKWDSRFPKKAAMPADLVLTEQKNPRSPAGDRGSSTSLTIKALPLRLGRPGKRRRIGSLRSHSFRTGSPCNCLRRNRRLRTGSWGRSSKRRAVPGWTQSCGTSTGPP